MSQEIINVLNYLGDIGALFIIPTHIGELLRWAIVPEIQYLEMLKGLMG